MRTALGCSRAIGLSLLLLASSLVQAKPRIFPPAEKERPRSSYISYGRKAMVATAHPLASAAGETMLKQGGNAVDAAVAASFVISVVRPQSTGLGGGGFLLFHDAKTSDTQVWDFRERAPAAATRDMFLDSKGDPKSFSYDGKTIPNASMNGHLAVGTPGLVAGLVKIHAQHGKLPLKTVVAPAVKIAEEGFPVYPGLAEALLDRRDVLAAFPSSTKIFFKQGRPLKLGETLIQKDLSQTLRDIASKGAAGFYQGRVADLIVAEMQRGGGLLTKADLAAYQVKRREPVVGTYRGHKIYSMPPPSSGGLHIVQIMNILSESKYGSHGFGSAADVHLLAEAMRRAFADRAEYLGDPDFVKVPQKGLLSPAYAAKLFKTISLQKATPSAAVKPGNPQAFESPSTTHISVIDGEGHAVSTTQTINYSFGSCVVADGTGVVLNDEMDDFSIKPGVPNAFGLVGSDANAVAAHKTMLSSMSPSLVFKPDGRLFLAVGSPGGPRIITATLQTILNVLDYKMPLDDAVHAVRIHHQWLPDELRLEAAGLTASLQSELEAKGHKVVVKGSIGDVQAVGILPDGRRIGVSDTRSEGAPAGF